MEDNSQTGHDPHRPTGSPSTLQELLWNTSQASKEELCFPSAEGDETLTYGELFTTAKSMAHWLVTENGAKTADHILLIIESPKLFLIGFWAVLLAAKRPILTCASVSQFSSPNILPKLLAVGEHLSSPPTILTTSKLLPHLQKKLSSHQDLHRSSLLCIDQSNQRDEEAPIESLPPLLQAPSNETALILLTSGSTGTPKLVPLQHRNIVSMAQGSIAALQLSPQEITLNWLPLDHVGSIVFTHLLPTLLGCAQVHLESDQITRKPARWLEAIDKYRASLSWAPNFAFRALKNPQLHPSLEDLDLRCLRVLANAGERVCAATLKEFSDSYQPCGLHPAAIRPAFGMSECCSGITWSQGDWRQHLLPNGDVPLGPPIPHAQIQICSEEGRPLSDGEEGHLELKGPSVFPGYLNQDPPPHGSSSWFRTGDLAVFQNGNLYITGRDRDIVIINGVHHPCAEIERSLECLPFIAKGAVFACPIRQQQEGTGGEGESLAIAYLTSSEQDQKALEGQEKEIQSLVLQKFQLRPARIQAMAECEIPLTDIGKVNKRKLGEILAAHSS